MFIWSIAYNPVTKIKYIFCLRVKNIYDNNGGVRNAVYFGLAIAGYLNENIKLISLIYNKVCRVPNDELDSFFYKFKATIIFNIHIK